MKQKQLEFEKGLAGVGEEVRADEKSSVVGSNKLLALPVRQEINETLDVEKRKDQIVVRGIREDEDAEKRVKDIMEELGYTRQYQVVGRIGRLRKTEVGVGIGTVGDRSRLVSVKLGSVGDKWGIVSEARKLSKSTNMKEIFFSPDLTRKQADEDKGLMMKVLVANVRDLRLGMKYEELQLLAEESGLDIVAVTEICCHMCLS